MIRKLTVATLLSTTAALAQDDPTDRWIGDWHIYDIFDRLACYAVVNPASDGTAIEFGFAENDADGRFYEFAVTNPIFDMFLHGDAYAGKMIFDPLHSWDVTLIGVSDLLSTRLSVALPLSGDVTDRFVADFRGASNFSLEVNGITYGPVSLSGSSKAFAALAPCQAESDAFWGR